MPLLGAHMSIAGGVANALLLGKSVDCAAIQIFTRSARQWAAKPYTHEEVEQFLRNRKKTGIGTVIAHDSYLLNLASPDGALRNRSVAAFVDEFERCETLGVTHLIAHPGARLASFLAAFDLGVIDGAVNGVARLARGTGTLLRSLQSGYVRGYVVTMLIGAFCVLAFWAFR